MEDYHLKYYKGSYPILSVYFQQLHPEWGCSYDYIDQTMIFFMSEITNQDLYDLRKEIGIILAKKPDEILKIVEEHNTGGGYGVHEKNEAVVFLVALIYFTEKEMQKRGMEISENSALSKKDRE